MPYTPVHVDWKDYPDLTTPVDSTALETIETGLTKMPYGPDFSSDRVPVWNGSAWVSQKITNAQVDAAAAIDVSKLAGSWTAYVPVWTSTGTAPALGNGSLTGRYFQIGKLVTVWISLVMGSTTTFGSGVYFLSLPVADSGNPAFGSGMVDDASPAAQYPFLTKLEASSQKVSMWVTTAASTIVTNTVPITFASGDVIRPCLTYEAA